MLDTPRDGYCTIHMGTFAAVCNCGDDVPFALLDALTNICKSNQPSAVRFEADNASMTLVFDFDVLSVIQRLKSSTHFFTMDANCFQLATELISDLRSNLDAWVCWDPALQDPAMLQKRREGITTLCDELEQLADFYLP